MSFWFSFSLTIISLLLFKSYIIKGVYEAVSSRKGTAFYASFSFSSLIIGAFTLVTAFADGIMGLSVWQNFIIALMISVIVCEIILALFFLADDILLIGRWLKNKNSNKEKKESSPTSRRRFLKRFGLGFTALPFASFLYGITKGKYNFQVLHETLIFTDLPSSFDGFTIVQFSDLHSGGFDDYEAVKKGFDLIQAQNADVILFTGDLVNDRAEEIIPYKPLLQSLHAPFGKFSVLGNHDYPEDSDLFPDEIAKQKNFAELHRHHADTDFKLLNNANVKLKKQQAFIRLIGVENWGKGFIKEGDLDKAIEGCGENEFSILLSHDPTHWEEVVLKHPKLIQLTLAGHTHGMQLGIEMLGIKWSPIQYFYKRWAGLYKEFNQYLYVNRGFGFMAFAGRVGIPPEITVFTLKRA